MQDLKRELVLEYVHHGGVWSVAMEETRFPGMCILSAWDGDRMSEVPLLLTPSQVEMTIEKLGKIPPGSVNTFDLFSMCVSGAASLSIKYGR